MENSIKKSIQCLIITVVVLVLLVIGMASYIVYDKVLSKNETANNNLIVNNNVENNSSNTINNNQVVDNSGSNIMVDDYTDLIKNATISYEDNNYVSYEVRNYTMCGPSKYIVYDKINKKYINDNLNDNSIISYFGKVLGKYYYFEEYFVNRTYAATNVYDINGTLVVNKPYSFESFNEDTNTFKFSNCPGAIMPDPDPSVYEWSPAQ